MDKECQILNGENKKYYKDLIEIQSKYKSELEIKNNLSIEN